MSDLRTTIVPKSDQMNSDDLIGRTITIKVTGVALTVSEQPVAISYEGDGGKPYKPGKSMRRVLVNTWGPDGNTYIGRSMTLYRDEKVVFGGLEVGGIRISHLSNIDHPMTMALTATRGNKKPFTVRPLVPDAPKPDKGALLADDLIARVKAATQTELVSLLADTKVIEQRAWLTTKRPELAARVEAAIAYALATLETISRDEAEG